MTDTKNSSTDHLPRTESELAALNVRERILLSVATASGSNAVAYYVPDGKGGFSLTDHIDLYDLDHKNPTSFSPTLPGFQGGTFANEDAVRRTSESGSNYQIAVTGKNGRIEGIIVLHPPQDGYMQVQSQDGAQQDSAWRANSQGIMPDLHEPAVVRLHKLQMASDIVERDKAALLHHGEEVLAPGQALGSRRQRDETLLIMAKDLAYTFPTYGEIPPEVRAAVAQARDSGALLVAEQDMLQYENNMQAAHLKNTGTLVNFTVDALNEGHHILNNRDRSRAVLLGMVHDAGKLQSPYTMFQDIGNAVTAEDKKKNEDFGRYTFETNGNHDYLDIALLPLDPAAGAAIGHHHQGNRYTQAEWRSKVGDAGIQQWEIHNNHQVSPESISTLSRMLRVDDVTEAITARGPKSLAAALRDMTGKAVALPQSSNNSDSDFAVAKKAFDDAKGTLVFKAKDMDPNTIDRDALCFMIEHHVFENYGRQRDEEEKRAGKPGWSKYNADELKATEENILKMLHWDERKKEIAKDANGNPIVGADGKTRTIEDNLRWSVRTDPVFEHGSEDAAHLVDKAIHAAGNALAKFGKFIHSKEVDSPNNTPTHTLTSDRSPQSAKLNN